MNSRVWAFGLGLTFWACKPAESPVTAKPCPTEAELERLAVDCRERVVRECGQTAADDCPAFVECSNKIRDWQDCNNGQR